VTAAAVTSSIDRGVALAIAAAAALVLVTTLIATTLITATLIMASLLIAARLLALTLVALHLRAAVVELGGALVSNLSLKETHRLLHLLNLPI
jgi:hypothetical protein